MIIQLIEGGTKGKRKMCGYWERKTQQDIMYNKVKNITGMKNGGRKVKSDKLQERIGKGY